MSQQTHILIVGGRSRIGTALAVRLGDGACSIVRHIDGNRNDDRAIEVADYADVPPAAFVGVERAIMCVGVSTGSRELLHRLNVETPHAVALAAKTAGLMQFIHISSFSVHGTAEAIGPETPVAPTSDYGRSKLAGDEALLALADDKFRVTILRLPLIYATGSQAARNGKLDQLLRLWARVRWMPVPVGDVARAMIGVDLAADTIARLVQAPIPETPVDVLYAADPAPFTYADVMRTRSEPLHRLPVPRALARLAAIVVPALGRRLFADSRLAGKDNLAVSYGLASRLYGDIAGATLR